jgi:hypothetical protein
MRNSESAGRGELAIVDRGHGVPGRQCDELFRPSREKWIRIDDQRAQPRFGSTMSAFFRESAAKAMKGSIRECGCT